MIVIYEGKGQFVSVGVHSAELECPGSPRGSLLARCPGIGIDDEPCHANREFFCRPGIPARDV